jgi:hypothetical protein
MKESLRYLNNAKEILKSAPIEDSTYMDIKPVREACGTACLAVLMAIDEHLLKLVQVEKSGTSVIIIIVIIMVMPLYVSINV